MYSCKYNRWKIIKVKFTKLSGRISEVNVNKNFLYTSITSIEPGFPQDYECNNFLSAWHFTLYRRGGLN